MKKQVIYNEQNKKVFSTYKVNEDTLQMLVTFYLPKSGFSILWEPFTGCKVSHVITSRNGRTTFVDYSVDPLKVPAEMLEHQWMLGYSIVEKITKTIKFL